MIGIRSSLDNSLPLCSFHSCCSPDALLVRLEIWVGLSNFYFADLDDRLNVSIVWDIRNELFDVAPPGS